MRYLVTRYDEVLTTSESDEVLFKDDNVVFLFEGKVVAAVRGWSVITEVKE